MENIKILLYVPWSELSDVKEGENFWAYTTPSNSRFLMEIPSGYDFDIQDDSGEVWVFKSE